MHLCTADGDRCTCCPCRSAQVLQSSLEDIKAMLAEEQQKSKIAGEILITWLDSNAQHA